MKFNGMKRKSRKSLKQLNHLIYALSRTQIIQLEQAEKLLPNEGMETFYEAQTIAIGISVYTQLGEILDTYRTVPQR